MPLALRYFVTKVCQTFQVYVSLDLDFSPPGLVLLLRVLVLHSLFFDGRGTTEVTSVRSCWKRPPCPEEQVLDGSEDGSAAGRGWTK